jgi:transcriptional regulator with XRE-family HTH domain
MCKPLAQYLKAAKITKVKFAEACGVSNEYVVLICQGRRRPSAALAARISAATAGQISVKALLYPDGLPEGAVFDGGEAAA